MDDIIYQHFKGNYYRLVGMAKHSETGEAMVVYEPLYPSESKWWVRPAAMFEEMVEVSGVKVPRFARVTKNQG